MRITPQSDFTDPITNYVFRNRVCYDVFDQTELTYILHLGGDVYFITKSSEWVELPDNVTLDPRNPLQKAYDDLKQRDTDYIKVYKERMGIKVYNSYAEEDYYRHRNKNASTPDVGLPVGYSLSDQGKEILDENS